jgi:type III secretory pathway component EscR
MPNPHPHPQPLGRGNDVFSEKRFGVSVTFLQSAIANPKVPVAVRMNAVCLLMTIYGLQAPQTRAVKQQVKDLVTTHSFQKQMAAQVDRQIAEEDAAREQALQDEAHALELQTTREMFDAVLAEVGDD